MHLRNCLLFALVLSLFGPLAVQAQEKFEINVGVSHPGLAQIATDNNHYYYYSDYSNSLTDLEGETYKSFHYPALSVEFAYKLADSGFFKKLDLLGYLGFQAHGYQEVDVISNTSTNRETAIRASILIGLRYNYYKKTRSDLYSQFLLGTDAVNKCHYWDIVYDNFSGGVRTAAQVTFIGFNIKLGPASSKFNAMVELGYGSEYASNIIPLIPGVRTGLSYKF